MLVGISERLLEEGRARVEKARTPSEALESLVAWHTDFALQHRSLIVVQERDWPSLPQAARERVRHLQREYVDLWAGQLRRLHRGLHTDRAQAMAHAAFGLINSTPHTRLIPDEAMRGRAPPDGDGGPGRSLSPLRPRGSLPSADNLRAAGSVTDT